MTNTKFTLWAASLFATTLALPAVAQTGVQIEEIVVTAQKRVENVQDVPIAITAFTQATLSDKNISAIQGLSNFSPNVTLDAGSPFSGSTSVLTAYIRGIGQDDFAFNLDPGVGVYLDGVYLARTVGANTNLLDVERIEVLKGPQGTLFGRNSIGGAISIVTREPDKEFNFRGELITGRFDRLEVKGSVDIPLIEDTLLSTFTFATNQRDGYVKRIPFPTQGAADPLDAFPRSGAGSSNTEGEDDSWTVRTKLLWSASERLSVSLSGDYQDVDQAGMANTLLDTFPLEGFPGELFGTAYNLCISVPTAALPTDPGGNIAAMCGPRGTIGTSIAEVNIDAEPGNDRLLYSDEFITDDIDRSYATGPTFSRLTNLGGLDNHRF